MSSAKDHNKELNLNELIKDKDGDKDKEIGRSDYGVVYSGTYYKRKVAIKEIVNHHRPTPGKGYDEDFNRDMMLMEKFHHDAIVEFIGAVYLPDKQIIVTELCEYGSLDVAMDEYLEEFNEMMKVKCLMNVASAMRYLHSESIIHKDLKPQNVLIVSLNPRHLTVVAKLTDICTARSEKRINCTSTGYDPFMAPEILQRSSTFDKSIDVYSFSMLMYFIFAEKLPINDAAFGRGSDAYEQIISGKRPTIPSTCSKDVGRLMQQCWNGDSLKRPSFEQILSFMEVYYEQCKYGKEGAKARQCAVELIHQMKLDTEEELIWSLGGTTAFNLICELLKTNAISTKRLELKGEVNVENSMIYWN